MKFSELTAYFEKLEATSSRLALIDVLSELFTFINSSDEIEKVIYLLQGRIAPFFEATEIGMAEKNVAGAVANAYGVDRDHVLKLYSKAGDMGIAVEQLASSIGRLTHVAGDAHQTFRGPVSSLPPVSARSAIAFGNNSLRAVGSPSSAATPHNSLSVSDVFEVLTQIAKTTGAGTVEKRQNLLVELLKKSDSLSAKYLVRIPLGNLRLGIGDPTILDGLAKAASNAAGAKLDRITSRKPLEGAYNRTSDLGLIAKTLFREGLKGVGKLKVMVGKPIRSELCERLPNPEKVIEKMGSVDAQLKYDGFRVQIHKDGDRVMMFSRNLENMTNMFPELIEATLKQIKAKSAILDTEALAYNLESEEFLPFQETTKRRRKYKIEEMAKTLPLKAFVFDILYKDGESLIDEPLEKRMKILKEVVEEDGILIRTKNQTISDPKKLGLVLDDAISRGLEGVVVKRLDSKYEAGGRNFNWVKLKRHSAGELHDTIDCVILGYIFGKGKRTAFGAGALLVGVYDNKKDEFVTVSKIGTGLTDEEWQEIKVQSSKFKVQSKPARVNSLITPSVWVKPEIVIEILADEITRSPIHTAGASINSATGEKEAGYALRFPRLVSFRSADKKPEDATTVNELIQMYKQQTQNSKIKTQK